MNVSQARSQLLALARQLDSCPDQVILLEHRDLGETLALTTASHLRYLELMAAELRKRERFKVEGSITTDLSDEELDEALRQLRAKQSQLSAAKVAALTRELADED